MGINFAAGMEMLYDAHLRYTRGGLQAFLRVNNFAPSGDFIEVGVPYVPTGTEALETGFVDILIDPPPATQPISYHDIGLSGGKLMFGARKFFISNTFVDDVIQQYPKIKGRYNVWRKWDGTDTDPGTAYVMGIVYNNQLYSIEDIGRREIAGQTINWIITCNSHEEYLSDGAEEVEVP